MLSRFDAAQEAEHLILWTRNVITTTLRRDGAAVGVSGGVDSATTLHLLVRALGPERVIAVLLPDRDSSLESSALARHMTEALGARTALVDITPALLGMHCYERRDAAVRRTISEYDPEVDKFKIVLPQDLLSSASLNVFSAVVVKPDGSEIRRRLRPGEVNEIVAASNLKQRTRMMALYLEAESRNYAVAGTTQKDEHELGFFVKYGDGGTDLQPLRHLYKTQVYQVAEYLGVPSAIRERPSTTDTYSAECTQEEFFYRLPFAILDAIWEGGENGQPAEETARELGLTIQQVESARFDIRRKQKTTEYVRMPALAPTTLATPGATSAAHGGTRVGHVPSVK
jgi:NAD+ synthase